MKLSLDNYQIAMSNTPMKIGEALPQVFDRSIPVLDPDTEIILAVSQLLFHKTDALPMEFRPRQRKRHAIFGYACLDELLRTPPDDYAKFLYSPCVKTAKELARSRAEDNIESFLHVFQESGFGFSWVDSKRASGFASVLDSLELFAKGLVDSVMTVGETASPIFSLPGETRIDDALQEMFDRKFRRVFVEGKNRLLTDRRIIGKVFSTERLPLASTNPKSFLDLKLNDIEAAEPLYFKENARIKEAAISIRKVDEETLICEKGVTAWDLMIKPLEIGKLQIKA
jgi:hypothetical protein